MIWAAFHAVVRKVKRSVVYDRGLAQGIGAMAEYRIVRAGLSLGLRLPGSAQFRRLPLVLNSATDANAWIAEDRRIAGIDALLVPAPPLRLREILIRDTARQASLRDLRRPPSASSEPDPVRQLLP